MGKEKKKRDKGSDDTRSVVSSSTTTNDLEVDSHLFLEAAPPMARPPPPPLPYTPMEPIKETDPHRRREIKRHRAVTCIVLEKCLSNLGVIAELQVGDKLDFTSTGDFVIHRPTWVNTATRTLKRVFIGGTDRWRTHDHISNLFGTAEAIVDEGNINDPRVRTALINSVYGLRNLLSTYDSDPTFRNKLQVLLQRVEMRYDLGQFLVS